MKDNNLSQALSDFQLSVEYEERALSFSVSSLLILHFRRKQIYPSELNEEIKGYQVNSFAKCDFFLDELRTIQNTWKFLQHRRYR